MNNSKKIKYLILLLGVNFFLASCGFRSIPQSKNEVESTIADITNQYKRRADLIPNLVKTVKGYAKHERGTLEAVVNARAKATSTKLDVSNLNPKSIKAFQAAQGGLSQALGKLMVVVEKYPDLKANQNFRDLQAQLEGTENRITVARSRHIEAIKKFNNLVSVPPESFVNSMFYKHTKMPQWSVGEAEKEKIEKTPEVNF